MYVIHYKNFAGAQPIGDLVNLQYVRGAEATICQLLLPSNFPV